MKTEEVIKTLRNRQGIRMWDSENELIHTISLNKKDNTICWIRAVSKVGGQNVIWNKYLSLKDVLNIRSKLIQMKAKAE